MSGETLREIVAEMRAIKHQECEEPWYSCPLSEEGCADERQEGCTCPVGTIHAMADRIERAIAQGGEAMLHAAYYAGWKKAASWAKRDDLIYDEGSMAYDKDRDEALAEIAKENIR